MQNCRLGPSIRPGPVRSQTGKCWGHLYLPVPNLQSGILSALPFMFGCVCIILGGLLADFLLSRKILRLVTIRKLFTAVGKGPTGYRGCGSPGAHSFMPFVLLQGSLPHLESSCPCLGSDLAAAPQWPSWYCLLSLPASVIQEPSLTSWI